MIENPFNIARGKPLIIGSGLIALDIVINGDPRQPPRLWVGGTCGNVLTILSYLKWQAYPVSRLNGDAASKHVMRDMARWGICLDFARSQPRVDTPIVVQRISQNSTGESSHKFLWNCPHCGSDLPGYKPVVASSAQEIAERIGKPKVFFFDRVSRGTLLLAKASAKQGALITFEPSGVGDPNLFREALSITHILKYSHERKRQMSDFGSVDGPLLEIETLGREGLRYRRRLPSCNTSVWQQLSAYPVTQVKDVVGSGDWCTAGIIHQLGQKGLEGFQEITTAQLHDALRFGQAMAAWNCRFEGARGGMYGVNKKTFKSEILQIISGNDCKLVAPDTPSKKVKNVFRRICPGCRDKTKATSSVVG